MFKHHRLLFNDKRITYALTASQSFHVLTVRSDIPQKILTSDAFIELVPIFSILVTQPLKTENAENLAIKIEKNLMITNIDDSSMQLLNFT